MKDKLDMKIKIQLTPKTTLVLATITCIGLMGITYFSKPSALTVREVVGSVVVPMQEGINEIGSWFFGLTEKRIKLEEALTENEALKNEVAALQEELKGYQSDIYRLQELEELLQLKNTYANYETIGATVVSKDPGNWYHKFTINKGTKDGLAVNMNVIADGGLVGIITDVTENFATVRAIISDESSVSGTTEESLDSCIVEGDLQLLNQGYLKLSYINVDANITNDAEIITSAISDRYLPGLVIGYAKDIKEDSNRTTKSGYLVPKVDFKHLKEVLVITTLKETSDKK